MKANITRLKNFLSKDIGVSIKSSNISNSIYCKFGKLDIRISDHLGTNYQTFNIIISNTTNQIIVFINKIPYLYKSLIDVKNLLYYTYILSGYIPLEFVENPSTIYNKLSDYKNKITKLESKIIDLKSQLKNKDILIEDYKKKLKSRDNYIKGQQKLLNKLKCQKKQNIIMEDLDQVLPQE